MNNAAPVRHVTPSAFAGRIGVAQIDITPPVGVYARMWGAAKHDTAAGIHRPSIAVAVAFAHEQGGDPLVLISIDLALLWEADTEATIRRPILDALHLSEERLMIACTHTHASPRIGRDHESKPGGELLKQYTCDLGKALCNVARSAVDNLAPAKLTWQSVRCALAANRDLVDPDNPQRYVCGFNPDARDTEDALLVGRITRDDDDVTIGTIVNYACHPTTLAWENDKLSPDWVGSMREVVEATTAGAPCAFIQGASGELGPAWQYVGDTDVPDQHGKVVGHAAASALHLMLRPGQRLTFDRVVESGAPLAVWKPKPFDVPTDLAAQQIDVELPLRPMPSVEELQAQLEKATDRFMQERLSRKMRIVSELGDSTTKRAPVWIWRLGNSLIVGHRNEAYSRFQRHLRSVAPDAAIAVGGLVNGAMGYLYPPQLSETDLYQVWQSPFAKEALPALERACAASVQEMLAAPAQV